MNRKKRKQNETEIVGFFFPELCNFIPTTPRTGLPTDKGQRNHRLKRRNFEGAELRTVNVL